MRVVQLAADPLWQCLCPAWTAPSRVALPTIQALKPLTQRRQFSKSPRPRASSNSINLERHSSTNSDLSALGVQDLYHRLGDYANKRKGGQCHLITKHLIQHRGETPNTRMYNALILCNAAAESGSVWHVYMLLAEMEREGCEMDVATCHSILRVLAVHPDHLLRQDVLQYLKDRWLSLSTDGHLDVVVGYLREGCFEMALDTMDELRKKDVILPPWLHDMTAYMLSEAGEFDAAYQIIRERWNIGEEFQRQKPGPHGISDVLWHHLLDKASAKLHHPMTEFVWRTRVETGRTQASTGMCINTMSTAARAGDPALATQVFGYITKRGEKITALHFQLLIDAYMNMPTPDLDRALNVLTVMSLEKLSATRYHTRSIYAYLKDSPSLLQGAFETLRRLKDDGKDVPVAALNVVIESYCEQKNLSGALDVYKQIHTFSRQRRQIVDGGTFEPLLKACRTDEEPNTDVAEFILAEMQASKVDLDTLTYDRLILIFITASMNATNTVGDMLLGRQQMDRAMQYFVNCRRAGFVPRLGTIELLAVQLAYLSDSRCWDMFQYAVDAGIPSWEPRLASVKKKLEETWQRSRDEGPEQVPCDNVAAVS